MHKLTEEQKLNYFQILHRDHTNEVWQTLKIDTETTLTNILQAFNKESAKANLKVSKYKFDQMRYGTTAESFTAFLTKFKKTAKQANGEIAETFLFAKHPVQIQYEYAMAGKHDATIDEIKTFVQRRCQYAQLIPGTSCLQHLNQMYNYKERQQGNQRAPTNNRSSESLRANADTAISLVNS